MKYVDYFFYKFYCTILKTGEKESPYINAYIGIAAMISFNILSVILLLGIDLGEKEVISMLFCLIATTYFLFVYKQRYIKIYSRFVNNDPYPRLGYVIVISYIVLSFAGIICAAFAVRNGLA
jgi:hypothetical protein